jgi:urease subunit alpha
MLRRHYADMFGPTVGDKVRLADTTCGLKSRRTTRFTATSANLAAARRSAKAWVRPPGLAAEGALDCVITNALVVDPTGIFKADIGIKGGRIAGIGKAGNPDVMAGVGSKGWWWGSPPR